LIAISFSLNIHFLQIAYFISQARISFISFHFASSFHLTASLQPASAITPLKYWLIFLHYWYIFSLLLLLLLLLIHFHFISLYFISSSDYCFSDFTFISSFFIDFFFSVSSPIPFSVDSMITSVIFEIHYIISFVSHLRRFHISFSFLFTPASQPAALNFISDILIIGHFSFSFHFSSIFHSWLLSFPSVIISFHFIFHYISLIHYFIFLHFIFASFRASPDTFHYASIFTAFATLFIQLFFLLHFLHHFHFTH